MEETIKDKKEEKDIKQSIDAAIGKKTLEENKDETAKTTTEKSSVLESQSIKPKASDASETKASNTADESKETNKKSEEPTTEDKKPDSQKPEPITSSATPPAVLPQGKKARLAKKSTGQFACKGTNNGIIIGQKSKSQFFF